MARIAVGGFQHETNTFSPMLATLGDFEAADAWPPRVSGGELLDAVAGVNLPIAGAVEELREAGHEVLPLSWCSAGPSGPVTDQAFETISRLLLDGLAAAGRVDGLYLDLHGAMVTESIEDAEGEFLGRLRARFGTRLPVVASLDLHANLTPAMMRRADALVGYRTYPHVDMAETGARAAALLVATEPPRARAFAHADYLLGLTAQCTLETPMSELVELAGRLEGGAVASVSLVGGFALADVTDAGPAAMAWGRDQPACDRAVSGLAAALAAAEPRFREEILSPEAAVRRALVLSRRGGPVILADTQDNPGAGGHGDTVTLIRELVARRAKGAVAGLLFDPAAAAAAHAAGEDAALDIGLGAKSRTAGERPLTGTWRVLRLGDGRITGTGPFYRGARMDLGPMALMEAPGGVKVVVASRRQQAADGAMFRHLGVEPAEAPILALKSSVHFRADFGPLASAVLIVGAPGPCVADLGSLAYRRLRPGVRLGPGGPAGR